MHRILRRAVPRRLRDPLYKLRRLGLVKFLYYYRIERAERRKPPPRAGTPFDIGGGQFVPDDGTVLAVVSHWVDYAHGILELRAFKKVAASHRLLLDIGAAEGIYSAAFCALTGHNAWAFEPSPQKFAILETLCRLNPALAIQPANIALAASSGQHTFRRYPDGQLSGVGATTDDAATLGVTTLDAFLANRGLEPDFAKIDVEGMELDVLRGGERTFRDLIQTIVLEVHYLALAEGGQSAGDLQMLLEDYGFRLESLEGSHIDELENYARSHPEPLPGYTVVVCRKVDQSPSDSQR